jgi:hypothetical protein
MHRDDLVSHYLATSYRADAPGGPLIIRVGRPDTALDALLDSLGAREWAFITAYNPGSVPRSPEENELGNRDLLERLRDLGHDPLPGAGIGDDGIWPPEPSFFVAGIGVEEALRLGRLYGQLAVVAGRRGEAPRLLWC